MTVATSPRHMFRKAGRSEAGNGYAVSVRISEDLMQRLAVYGNAKSLTLAETVRALLELGLDAA